MKVFEELASDLDTAWTQCARDELAFPELARSALQRFASRSTAAPEDVSRWLVTTDRLPPQFDPRSTFGNFALTIAARDGFHIDLLVWTDSTTAIHQHRFSGAFHVLHGSSLHTLWSFQETRRWSDRLKGGRLAVQATEWLRAGSTRLILPGPAMIHSLFHLDSPSVTVVVRTPYSAVASPQLCYQRSGLAYDEHFTPARVEKIRQMLCTLWTSGHPQRTALSELALSGMDAHSAVRMVLSIGSQTPVGTERRLIDMLATREPDLANLLLDTVCRLERERLLLELRKHTVSPRHRMLLALILNLPDRASIISALGEIVPGSPPENWIWETIRSMADTPSQRSDRKSVLGISLNEVSEEVLRLLLSGYPADEVSKAVAGHDDLVEDVRALCSALSALPVLGPLCAANGSQGS
jgi:hypothetical protein